MGATNTSLDRFAAFLVRYVERLFRSTGTRCVVRGADSIPAINVPPGVQHQMIAIARESINNVVKHANATEAVLSMHVQDGVFELSISDNGAGFDVAAVSAAADGNGLRNICARAREIGGSLELTSTPGGGSRVVLRVPLSGSSTR
jgi:signal transduction histidine kinase